MKLSKVLLTSIVIVGMTSFSAKAVSEPNYSFACNTEWYVTLQDHTQKRISQSNLTAPLKAESGYLQGRMRLTDKIAAHITVFAPLPAKAGVWTHVYRSLVPNEDLKTLGKSDNRKWTYLSGVQILLKGVPAENGFVLFLSPEQTPGMETFQLMCNFKI